MSSRKKSNSLMSRAWQLAKAAAERFGGTAKEYLGSAMRTAWALFRAEQNAPSGIEIIKKIAVFVVDAAAGIGRFFSSKAGRKILRKAVFVVKSGFADVRDLVASKIMNATPVQGVFATAATKRE